MPRHVPVGSRRPSAPAPGTPAGGAATGGGDADIGAAIADLFPDVVLTGSAGLQGGPIVEYLAPLHRDLVDGPAVNAPFLDFGALDEQAKIADFRTQALLVGYREAMSTLSSRSTTPARPFTRSRSVWRISTAP